MIVKNLDIRGGSRISGKEVHMFKDVGVRSADFISFFLKGTATLMMSMFYQKELYEP